MRTRTVLIALVLAGCVGSDGPNGRTEVVNFVGAHDQFDHWVEPLLVIKCGHCHNANGGIVALDYYTIVNDPMLNGGFDPSKAAILTLTLPVHAGMFWTPDQAASIAAWLEDEGSVR